MNAVIISIRHLWQMVRSARDNDDSCLVSQPQTSVTCRINQSILFSFLLSQCVHHCFFLAHSFSSTARKEVGVNQQFIYSQPQMWQRLNFHDWNIKAGLHWSGNCVSILIMPNSYIYVVGLSRPVSFLHSRGNRLRSIPFLMSGHLNFNFF